MGMWDTEKERLLGDSKREKIGFNEVSITD